MKSTRKILFLYEVEVTDGLEFITEAELQRYNAKITARRPGEIDFEFAGDLRSLLNLKTVQNISLLQKFAIPRPRALLSNEYLPLIVQQIETVLHLSPQATFQTFYLAAAGSDSAIMQRIKTTISEQTGLVSSNDKGDLWIRVRPGKDGGWEMLTRLSPRPLVTRSWRVCNLEGALNAATAHAIVMLTKPTPKDRFVNLGCGSGTLLIERLDHGRCPLVIGFDHDPAHLRCAQANIDASGWANNIQLQLADMTEIPLETASVSVLCADLPFGQLSGTHQANQRLYPLALHEAARVARSGARFVLITHEIRLMESVMAQSETWSLERAIPVNLRGLHPRIYVLRRR